MAITIKDLAKKAGVSHTTVSRALNDSPLLKASTIKRIKALAEAEGYAPNYTAKALKMSKSFTYGLFFSTLNEATTNHFVYEAIKGVRQHLPDGYRLTVEGIDAIADMDQVNTRNYDGVLVISQRYEDDAFIDLVTDRGLPVVVLNRVMTDRQLVSIVYDDDEGIYNAAQVLYDKGHNKIAYIGGKKGFCNTDRRLDGFKRARADLNFQVDPYWIREGDYTLASGYDQCNAMLEYKGFTALICANDEMAVGAMKAIREHGLVVGQDISLIGFDDNENNFYMDPPLSSVKRSVKAMTSKGIDMLNQMIEDWDYSQGTSKHRAKDTRILKTELIIRASVEALK